MSNIAIFCPCGKKITQAFLLPLSSKDRDFVKAINNAERRGLKVATATKEEVKAQFGSCDCGPKQTKLEL